MALTLTNINQVIENMYAVNALKLLTELSKLRGDNIFGCIHHTDGGSQYKAHIYKKMLNKLKMKQSIAENCLQNGMAEQLNGLIKNGYLFDKI